MATSLGQKVRDLRKKKGFTLDELAAQSKSSKSYIWELENKDPPRPSGEKLALIAEALGVTPDHLLGVDTETAASPEDKAFFRKYQKMDPELKSQLRDMLDVINKKR
jgi:transcriptional regulator with XRE-family HTH domain